NSVSYKTQLFFHGRGIADNVLGLCEVAENRRRKFRFRQHVANANFYLLIYEKKPIKLAFADYEAKIFNLDGNPPFCKTLVINRLSFKFFERIPYINSFFLYVFYYNTTHSNCYIITNSNTLSDRGI